MRQHWTSIVALGAVLAAAAPAAAEVTRLCVQVKTEPTAQLEGLRKLVLDEAAHHPSHRVVEADCETRMVVELFAVSGQKFLTARIEGEVPVRYEIDSKNQLVDRVGEAMTLVLGNDPVHLSRDITHLSLVERASNSILRRGNNYYRVELFQLMGNSNNALAFAPGAAFSLTRGADNWQVFARAAGAGWPGRPSDNDAVLRVLAGLDVGLTYEFNDVSSTSPYISAGLGLQYQRFEGFSGEGEARRNDVANQILAVATVRAGVRFLRIFDFDCDLFVAGHLPLHPVRDEDSRLFRESKYTPFLSVGVGVGF